MHYHRQTELVCQNDLTLEDPFLLLFIIGGVVIIQTDFTYCHAFFVGGKFSYFVKRCFAFEVFGVYSHRGVNEIKLIGERERVICRGAVYRAGDYLFNSVFVKR